MTRHLALLCPPRGLDVRANRGQALVMSLGLLFVMGIAGATMMMYSVGAEHHADSSKAGQVAYALAEAGLNDAYSVLANNYPTTWPGDASLLPPTTQTLTGGSVTYAAALSTLSATWTVTSTSTVRDPTGSSTPVHRTLTALVPVNLNGTTTTIPPAWNWIYSGATGSSCDVTLQQSVALASPLYVAGNLCLQNTSTITQPAGATGNRLVVGGNLTLSQSGNTVGTTGARLSEAHVLGSCKYKNNAAVSPCQANTTNTNVWVQSFFTTAPVPAIPVPTVDWWGNYQRGSPGPFRPCFKGTGTVPTFEVASETTSAVLANMNADVPGVFNLTPATSYTCTSGTGTLTWDAATKVLSVSGTIFIDASASIDLSWASNITATYSGQAVLYAYGTILMKNSTLCAVAQTGGGCNTSSGAWDPNQNVLILAAHGNGSAGGAQSQVSNGDSVQVVSSTFQGGLYGTNAIDIGTTSQVQGPLVSPSTIMPGQSGSFSFPTIQMLPFSVPGGTAPLPAATLSAPLNSSSS
jgi:hypothetical protein